MRILFVAPRMIGDAVMSCGILDHLAQAHPEARITIVASPEAAGLFEHMPGRARTIVLRKRRDHLHWPALWATTLTAGWWDMVIDLKGSALPYMLLARRRLMRKPRPGLQLYRQHADLLGLYPAPLPVVWTGPTERDGARARLPDGPPWVALCPTASWAPKMWPAERFATLFRRLASEDLPGAGVAIFGGPGARERAAVHPLLAALPGAVDLCGALTLPENAACLARCALVVSNDSGLMHLSAAAGAPTLGLRAHAVSRAELVRPAGRHAAWILREGDDMAGISVDDALAGCRALLRQARWSGAERPATA